MTMGKIIGLDVGDVRIGIAVCDEMRLIASPHSVYRRVGFGPDVKHIKALCDQLGTRDIVCGLPRNMDGTEGQQAIDTRAFGDALRERVGLPIRYVDERLTSMSAHSMLHEGGLKRKDHKKVVDKVAAVLILQTYMQNPARSQE